MPGNDHVPARQKIVQPLRKMKNMFEPEKKCVTSRATGSRLLTYHQPSERRTAGQFATIASKVHRVRFARGEYGSRKTRKKLVLGEQIVESSSHDTNTTKKGHSIPKGVSQKGGTQRIKSEEYFQHIGKR